VGVVVIVSLEMKEFYMKVIKLIFAVLFGLYATAQGVQFLISTFTGRYISVVLGNLCGLCLGAAFSIVLFRSALKTNVKG
jgi:hypothetical protein